MLLNYSNGKSTLVQQIIAFLLLPTWVVVGFFSAQLLVGSLLGLLFANYGPLKLINPAVLQTTAAAIVYIIALLITMGLPYLILKHPTTLENLGFNRLPSWTDIVISPAGLIIYFILSSIALLLAIKFVPGFNVDQAQDIGFGKLNHNYEYILAFITLVVIAPIAEEVLFRGYLYSRLKSFLPIWAAILATSILFGAIHGSWNLAIDVFFLSIISCILREITGSLWASILLHMLKNGIAFYILFINPVLLITIR